MSHIRYVNREHLDRTWPEVRESDRADSIAPPDAGKAGDALDPAALGVAQRQDDQIMVPASRRLLQCGVMRRYSSRLVPAQIWPK